MKIEDRNAESMSLEEKDARFAELFDQHSAGALRQIPELGKQRAKDALPIVASHVMTRTVERQERLMNDMHKQSAEMTKLTKSLKWLTLVILFVGLTQLALLIYQLREKLWPLCEKLWPLCEKL